VSDFHNQYVDGFEAGQLALEGIIDSLTAERDELRKEIIKLKGDIAAIVNKGTCFLIDEQQKHIAQLQAKLAAVRTLVDAEWKKAEEERLKETDEHHAEAAKWKAEDDMYGWNFYEGVSSGTIGVSFIYHRMVRAIAETVKE
jgi:hypothetical protein